MHGAAPAPTAPQPPWRETLIDTGNMLKAFIGLNSVTVAYSFANSGLWRGVVGLLVITLVTEHCCMLLVRVKNTMPGQQATVDGYVRPLEHDSSAAHHAPDPQHLHHLHRPQENIHDPQQNPIEPEPPTYGDIALFVAGRPARNIVNACLVLTQFGYCAGYLIFLSTTLHDMLPELTGTTIPIMWLVLLPIPILICLAMLTSIRSLGPFSAMANAALLFGFASVSTYIARHYKWNPSSPPLANFPLFFGQMTGALEGIGLVVPVETSMRNKEKFPLVLRIALGTLSFVLLTVGVLGFTTYGADTQPIILINFGNSPVVTIVKSVLLIGILFTYPLQIIPVFQFCESFLVADGSAESSRELDVLPTAAMLSEPGEYDVGVVEDREVQCDEGSTPSVFLRDKRRIVLRVLIVLLTAFIAIVGGKNFGLYNSFVGALGASCLAYTAPAWLHLIAFGDELGIGGKIKDVSIIIMGISGAIIGTFVTIVAYMNHEDVGV